MAASRKLQGEIDRCLKKVSEGVETFEDIWQKVHNATNTNQKEKYETDLKKEIKKLQRLRDQIKSWIASGEIKDKSTLLDTRKLIETQMERFKVVERETKTKAYSKEGLGAAQKLDPMTRERDDLNNWLASAIDQVQIQMDQFDTEIESIMAGKKKRLDKDKQDRLDELKVYMEKHKFHMGKLETLLRMLDNLSVDPNALRNFLSQVKKIKDDIEYYLESSQEPEYEENEFLYDDIDGLEEQQALGNSVAAGLDSELNTLTGTPTSITSGNTSPSPVSPIHSSDSTNSSDPEKRRKSSDDSAKIVVRPLAVKPPSSSSTGTNQNHTNSTGSPVFSSSSANNNKVVNNCGSGDGGTPPVTPNNSSPSSGLQSNHVSSFSSLSSSPTPTTQTQNSNYHNALNNAKSQLESNADNESRSLLEEPTINGLLTQTQVPVSVVQESSDTINLNSNLGSVCPLSNASSAATSNGLIIGSQFTDEDPEESSNVPHISGCNSSPPPISHLSHLFPPRPQSPQSPEDIIGGTAPLSDIHLPNHHLNEMQMTVENGEILEDEGDPHDEQGLDLGAGTNPGQGGLLSMSSLAAMSMSALMNNTNVVNHLVGHHTSTSTTSSVMIGAPPGIPSTANLTTTSTTNGPSQIPGSSIFSLTQHQQQLLQQAKNPNSSQDSGSTGNIDQQLLEQFLNVNSDGTGSMDVHSLKSMAQEVMDRAGLGQLDQGLGSSTTEAHIPPLLGVAPLGPVPLVRDHINQMEMIDAAHYHMPVPADSERMRQFLPRNPVITPNYYPQIPLANSDSLDFFSRLSIETLFFIFYYLEGTKAQYLAAKVLKKQSWRFHTKYMMWFQRHEEPKVINEEFEQGTYIYFDIEKWGQRKKDGFVFEYRYLEDRDLS